MKEALKKEQGPVTITVGAQRRLIDLNASDWETQLRQWFLSAMAAFRAEGFPRTRQLLSSFAFGVLPTIIFFSSLMSMLYYLGVMQKIVSFFAWIMQRSLGTSGAETLSAAANVFVGQTEAPLVIRPYVSKMTQSELMAVMVLDDTAAGRGCWSPEEAPSGVTVRLCHVARQSFGTDF